MTNQEILHILHESVDFYDSDLCGKNFMFVYRTQTRVIAYIEVAFWKRCFQHLTGISTADVGITANDFYDRCLKRRLAESDIRESADGTTDLKLSILQQALRMISKAPMLGDYDALRIVLRTEKLVGGVHACMGFVRDKKAPDYFVPNTLLRDDIRNNTKHPTNRVLMILEKEISEPYYAVIRNVAKKVSLQEIISAPALQDKLDQVLANDILANKVSF